MKHIVTGGAGFIGSNLVDKLISDGHDVIVIDDLSLGNKDYINKNAEFHNIDISRLDPTVDLKLYNKAKKIFENVDTIFSCSYTNTT